MTGAREELLARWRAEESEQPEGWDFSALDGRMWADPPPWDLDAIWGEALGAAQHVLDMGTGGGEHLLRFRALLPADVVATECTPRSSSGWCTTSSCAPAATARSATSWVQSSAKATLVTSSAGSPQISPT